MSNNESIENLTDTELQALAERVANEQARRRADGIRARRMARAARKAAREVR